LLIICELSTGINYIIRLLVNIQHKKEKLSTKI